MKIIYPKQLFPVFFNTLNSYYVLIGNDEFFIQESKKIIISTAKKHGFTEYTIHTIEYHVDINYLSFAFKIKNIFLKKTIIILNLFDRKLTTKVQKQLSFLSHFINSNLLLIIHKNAREYMEEKIWINIFKLNGVIIYCRTIVKEELDIWIEHKKRELQITISSNAKNLLLQCYKKNIVYLYNILNVLKLIWPNSLITTHKIQKIISNVAIFTPEEWIDAILTGNLNKSMKILNNFYIKNYNQITLIRCLQHDLLTILMIQRKTSVTTNYILKKRNISKKRHFLLTHVANLKSFKIINQSIKLLTQIEITIKKKYEKSIWNKLKILSYMMNADN